MNVQQFLNEDMADVPLKITLKSGESFDFWQTGVSYGTPPELTGYRGDDKVQTFVSTDEIMSIVLLPKD